jgi:peptidoglycan/LPS O-acetylase OafA/YrhL
MMQAFGPGAYRLLLALIVVVHHVSRFNLGEFAVYAFFNLSGFWMASVWRDKYSNERGGYRTFILARFIRLAPLFWVGSLVGLVADVVSHKLDAKKAYLLGMGALETLRFAASNLFILGYNFLPYKALGPAWSLDVEMQYYLVLPLLFVLARRTRWLGLLCLMALLVAVKGSALQESLLGYAVFFYAGMLACTCEWKPSSGQVRGAVLLLGSLLLLLFATAQGRGLIIGGVERAADFDQVNKYVSALLALVCLPITIWSTRQPASSQDKVLGDLSYSVYLFHGPLAVVYGHWFGDLPPLQRLPYLLAYLVVTAVVSVAAWRWVDKPVMALRSRYLAKALTPRSPAM